MRRNCCAFQTIYYCNICLAIAARRDIHGERPHFFVVKAVAALRQRLAQGGMEGEEVSFCFHRRSRALRRWNIQAGGIDRLQRGKIRERRECEPYLLAVL